MSAKDGLGSLMQRLTDSLHALLQPSSREHEAASGLHLPEAMPLSSTLCLSCWRLLKA